MKKFVFTLQKVLDYKQQILEVLKNEMAVLEAKLREMETHIEEIRQESRQTDGELCEKLEDGINPDGVALYKRYLIELNRRAILLEVQKADLLRAVSAKRQEIIGMNSDISGLERLKDKQLAEYLSLSRKEQELMIEEFVSRARCSVG